MSDFWQTLHLEVRLLLEGIYWRMAFILIGGRRLFETGSLLEGTRYHMTVYIWSFCDYGVMKLYDSKSRSTVIFNLKAFDINVAQPEIFFWFWYMLSFNKKRFSMTLNHSFRKWSPYSNCLELTSFKILQKKQLELFCRKGCS